MAGPAGNGFNVLVDSLWQGAAGYERLADRVQDQSRRAHAAFSAAAGAAGDAAVASQAAASAKAVAAAARSLANTLAATAESLRGTAGTYSASEQEAQAVMRAAMPAGRRLVL